MCLDLDIETLAGEAEHYLYAYILQREARIILYFSLLIEVYNFTVPHFSSKISILY